MPDINVRKIARTTKTVPLVTPGHLVFTKVEDRIIISMNPKLCKMFEDREAFMEILYNDFLDNGIADLFVDKLNQGS